MALIFIRIENCLIELWFSFESKIVRYVHVNENENSSVRARMDFDSNQKLVHEMARIDFFWWYVQGNMVRTEVMSCHPVDRCVSLENVLWFEMYFSHLLISEQFTS